MTHGLNASPQIIEQALNKALYQSPYLRGLDLSDLAMARIVQALSTYIQLISKWGRVMNLTAVRDPLEMVHRHMLDSLSVVPYLSQSQNILDVGTGAGLPGIPLSIVLKNKHFSLLDSVLKKQIFLENVLSTLALSNVSLACTRVEVYQPGILFDTILSRAFAPLRKMLSLTEHLLAPHGRFLAMKGKIDQEEIESIGTDYEIESIESLELPESHNAKNISSVLHNTDHTHIARHLIIVRKRGELG